MDCGDAVKGESYFFLWRSFRIRFLRLWVAIFLRLRFLPLGMGLPFLELPWTPAGPMLSE